MKFSDLTESTNMFKDVDTINIDPDRHDASDVVDKILPSIIKMAYVDMVQQRDRHEKTRDEGESEYELSTNNLVEHTEDWLRFIITKLEELSSRDLKQHISRLDKAQFKFPLTDK